MPAATLINPGLSRLGSYLIARNGATLPPRCLVCNTSVQAPPVKLNYAFNPHGLRGRGIIGWTATIATNRNGHVFGYFCPTHKAGTLKLGLGMLTFALLFLVPGILMDIYSHPQTPLRATGAIFTVIGFIPFILSLVVLSKARSVFARCECIDDGHLWLNLKNTDLLQDLPEAQAPSPV